MSLLQLPLALLEGIENARQKIRLNSSPGVDDVNEQCSVLIARGESNLAAIGSKFDCVLDQVPKNLEKSSGVGFDKMIGGVQMEMHPELFRLHLWPEKFDRLGNHDMRIDGFAIERN